MKNQETGWGRDEWLIPAGIANTDAAPAQDEMP